MNSHQSLINKINGYSTDKIPFLLIVDFEMQKPVLLQMHELEKEDVKVAFLNSLKSESLSQTDPHTVNEKQDEIKPFIVNPIGIAHYQTGFSHVMQELKYGNSYLTNLTGKTEIITDASLAEIYEAAHAPYKIRYKDEWVCFSPECFVRIVEGHIFSYPMKGTIDAGLPDAARTLLEDRKEIAEHYTIVDLIRNDLSSVAVNVHVSKFRYLEEIHSREKTLLQASSAIRGKLAPGFQSSLGELLFALLPAGSVSGAPKKKTLEIIQQAESGPRGYYTGVAFYFDGENVDSCVLIRFIEKDKGKLFYRSGGGITVNSEMEKEYQELNDKIYVPLH